MKNEKPRDGDDLILDKLLAILRDTETEVVTHKHSFGVRLGDDMARECGGFRGIVKRY